MESVKSVRFMSTPIPDIERLEIFGMKKNVLLWIAEQIKNRIPGIVLMTVAQVVHALLRGILNYLLHLVSGRARSLAEF